METFHTGNAREQIADLLTEATKIIIEPSNDGTESAPLIEKALELMRLIVDSREAKVDYTGGGNLSLPFVRNLTKVSAFPSKSVA